LKKFDQNFKLEPRVRAIPGFPDKVFCRTFFQKSSWGFGGEALKVLKNFRKSLAVGIAAVVSTYVVFAYHFYEIPLYSVLGNLVIMPMVTIILVLGLAVGLVGLVSMNVALLLSGAVYFILRFYETAAIFFSSLPFAMVRTGGGNIFVSALGVLVLCTFAYMFHGFDESFRKRGKILAVSCWLLIVAIFVNANPPNLQMTELERNYTVLRQRSETLVIGAAHGGEDALLRYLDRCGVNKAALILTQPPCPQDTLRLARLLPRMHTIYLPAHAEGTTKGLMLAALDELPPEEINIVYLHEGEKIFSHDIILQIYALPMGELNIDIK
jgi:hypothetical protein